ncbi:MAG: TraR/DksA C4-type zinc finger protein [Candidatus Pacebacteria bacterium]|nr:TraR/DksA C4-type zinc finger protein [Candidatus Paceibacterota bacterium]
MAETATRNRYSSKELGEFKSIIESKIQEAQNQINILSGLHGNPSSGDEYGKTHNPFEEAAEGNSKEMNVTLIQRQEKIKRDLKNALIRIENKTYGVCRVTGKLINPERLKLVPHATLSIEAKNMQ